MAANAPNLDGYRIGERIAKGNAPVHEFVPAPAPIQPVYATKLLTKADPAEFRHELLLLQHNVISIVSYDVDRKAITMERMPCSMHDIINHFVLPEHAVVYILREIVVGLRYLHREKKVLHNDLKPQNVLLGSSGEVKIADFGLSQRYGQPWHGRGTVGYQSPEAIRLHEQRAAGENLPGPEIRRPAGEKPDLFAAGCVAAACFVRKHLQLVVPSLGQIAKSATSSSKIIKDMREDDDFKEIGRASLHFVDLLKQLLTPLDMQCASFRTILAMPVMELVEEKVIIDGREELRGQKILVDTVAILGSRKESAKQRKRQEEINAREQILTRSVLDQGVYLRERHPRCEALPLFNEPSSEGDRAGSHTPVEHARAQESGIGATLMRAEENSLADRLRLQASLADATAPRNQQSGSALQVPPPYRRIVFEDDSSDDIFTDEAGSPRQAAGGRQPPPYAEGHGAAAPQPRQDDAGAGAAEAQLLPNDNEGGAEEPPQDAAPPQGAVEMWREFLVEPQRGVFRCAHPLCTVPGGYEYGHRWTVIRHIKGHTGEDAVQCQFCDLRVREKYLKGHVRTAHPNAQ